MGEWPQMRGITEARGTYEGARDRAAELIGLIEVLGVRVPQYGRLREYAKQFATICGAGNGRPPRGLNLERLHRGLLEVAELSLIIEHLAGDGGVPGLLGVLAPAMSGGITLGDEKNQSSARDFQFEMLVAALFKRAGYGVALSEPDVIVTTNHGNVGIAAKRPRSQDNLRRLFEDADDQIRRSGYHGIVAIDISFLLLPNNLHIPAGDGGRGIVKAAVDAFAADTWKDARLFVDPSRTFGYIAYAALVAANHATPKLSVARGCVFGNFIPFSDDRMVILREFRERVTCMV